MMHKLSLRQRDDRSAASGANTAIYLDDIPLLGVTSFSMQASPRDAVVVKIEMLVRFEQKTDAKPSLAAMLEEIR